MRKIWKRLLTVLTIAAMLSNAVAFSAFAGSSDSRSVIRGTYQYTSNQNDNIQESDSFVYRDDCFMRSSFIDDSHLATLSAQVAISTASWYGEDEDKYAIDYSENGHNIVNMLKAMGFRNVKTNKYYSLEALENSAGVAVGMRELTVSGKTYTLLAVIPRCAGYKQEWTGNFTVGEGGVHDGFKQGRDEILRFVKKYIEDNGITGRLKVWTAGHSRGAALANMVGGFFAGGGIEYFGSSVSITPEDVYAYTYATPRAIKNGADKNETLSVEGKRGGEYGSDTPGEAFTYTKGGSVDIKGDEFKGIRNYVEDYDFITLLAPVVWGFEHYGTDIGLDQDGKVSKEAMTEELGSINAYALEQFNNGGDQSAFKYYDFDYANASLETGEDGAVTGFDPGSSEDGEFADFVKQRLAGLTYNAPTNIKYVEGEYEEALKATAGIFGMLLYLFDEIKIEDTDSVALPLAASVLAYADERLQAEGTSESEQESVAILLCDLLNEYTGSELDPDTSTFDELFYSLCSFINENSEAEMTGTLMSALVGVLDDNLGDFSESLITLFEMFCTADSSDDDASVTPEEALLAFIKACATGADTNSQISEIYGDYYADSKNCRIILYQMLSLAGLENFTDVIGEDSDGNVPLSGLSGYILTTIKTEKDDDGNVLNEYDTLADLADAKLTDMLDEMLEPIIEKSKELYGKYYYTDATGHFSNLKEHITQMRTLVTYLLFYNEGENFSSRAVVSNTITFASNILIIPLSHYNEVYIAWMKAAETTGVFHTVHNYEDDILAASAVARGRNRAKLAWNKVSGADRYVVYMSKCNSGSRKSTLKKVKTLGAGTLKWTTKRLKKNTAYKFKVVAQKKVDGSYVNLAVSKTGHFVTGNQKGSYTNPKSISLNKTKLTLSEGSSAAIKATVKKAKSGKKLMTGHTALLRYASSDPCTATVSSSGKVTAVNEGQCTIYVQTINGLWKTCRVTVTK